MKPRNIGSGPAGTELSALHRQMREMEQETRFLSYSQ